MKQILKHTISTTFLVLILLLNTTITSVATTLPFLPFSDIKNTDWFYEPVSYCYENDLFSGTSKNTFSPKQPMTRAMFVTVLYNMSNISDTYDTEHFLDVSKKSWYYNQVEWAADYTITNGTGEFTFSPNNNITRQDAVTLLYRYAELSQNLNPTTSTVSTTKNFKDYNKISDYAKTAMDWAIKHNIINGTPDKYLKPKATATRAEMAQIFNNIHKVFNINKLTKPESNLKVPDELDRQIYNMSIQELVGQVFQPRYPDSNQINITTKYQPAGYTFYEKDFKNKTKDQIIKEISNLQANSKIPLFIATDEEGGTVVRVSSNTDLRPEPFKSIQNIYNQSSIQGIIENTTEKSQLLTSLGINMNLAPVCDISTNPDDYIYKRTTGQDAETTSNIISNIVSTMNDNNVFSTLKHFPGYGNNLNTHTGISIDKRPFEQFETQDLLPFIAGIEQNASSVLISHNIVTCIDPDRPASLSSEVINLLRDDLNFDNIIMTDDLSMDAIKIYTNNQSPAVTAFLAGNDLLLTSDFETDYNSLLKAVNNGTISKSRLKESVKRILRVKYEKLN